MSENKKLAERDENGEVSRRRPAKRRKGRQPSSHPAGPHAKPELTDEQATPGTGVLPDPGQTDVEPGTG